MNRWLAFLAALLLLLLLAEGRLRQHRQETRRRAGTLRPLVTLPVEQVRQFEISLGDRRWQYVRRGSAWHYPAYYDALVQADRVEQLLRGLLQSYGTPVSAEPGDLARCGLDPAQAMRVALGDGAGRRLAEIRIGRGIPAPGADEAYAQVAGQDTLFHLHANPRRVLDDPVRLLVDPRVLPRGLGRGPLAEVTFLRAGRDPLERLRRVQRAPAGPPLPGLPPQGPTYEWLVTLDGKERTCAGSSAAEYLDFLGRLRYADLHPSGAYTPGPEARALVLRDETGQRDTLEVGGLAADGSTWLRLRTTGQVSTVTPAKAALLFPTVAALLDSLPRPSPYQRAEPFSPPPF